MSCFRSSSKLQALESQHAAALHSIQRTCGERLATGQAELGAAHHEVQQLRARVQKLESEGVEAAECAQLMQRELELDHAADLQVFVITQCGQTQ